ncbi:hypothetical protein L2E82_34450 [Cichorium intybus]|uniref:Uncharacterized protein n=1 Tax=Cichorium intybus TaxID=13427 RepID=A0ACB9BM67_CICIN|nr:hypothetical protein L2E82_34450 [Cichorium intybus]
MTMGSSSLRIQSLQTAFDSIKIDKIQVRYATTITCGLRKPMRTRRPSDGVLSTEATQAVQSLKLAARNPSKLHQVFDSKLSRLLKYDLLDAFAELQRQQHLELAVKPSKTLLLFKICYKTLNYLGIFPHTQPNKPALSKLEGNPNCKIQTPPIYSTHTVFQLRSSPV